MPPPTSLRARCARRMTSFGPTTTLPMGQPRPLLRQNVTVSPGAASSFALTPVRDDGVEEACAVDVERDAALVRDRRDLLLVGQAQRLAAGRGVGVLDHDQAGDRLVRRRGSRNEPRICSGSIVPSGAVGERPDAAADDDRVAARLIDHHVSVEAGDGLVAARRDARPG